MFMSLFFSQMWMSFTLVGNITPSHSCLSACSLSSLVTLCGLSSTGFNALVTAHLKHIFDSLHWLHSSHFFSHSLFIILITAFFLVMIGGSLLYPAPSIGSNLTIPISNPLTLFSRHPLPFF